MLAEPLGKVLDTAALCQVMGVGVVDGTPPLLCERRRVIPWLLVLWGGLASPSPSHTHGPLFRGLVLLLVPGLGPGRLLIVHPGLRGPGVVPMAAFRHAHAFVCEREQIPNICDVVDCELLQHLLVTHPLSECDDHGGWRDPRNGIPDLTKKLHESAQRLVRLLPDGM